MPEILLSLIALLLIAVIIMLFFRRQEISVKVENVAPQAYIEPQDITQTLERKNDTNKAKLPLDYHHAWLVEKEGPHTGRKYKLNWHVVTLGFSDDNSIVIDDNTVSPRHAKIERQARKFVLFDLMSENGTYLNGRKVAQPRPVRRTDRVYVGDYILMLEGDEALFDEGTIVAGNPEIYDRLRGLLEEANSAA